MGPRVKARWAGQDGSQPAGEGIRFVNVDLQKWFGRSEIDGYREIE